MEGKHMALLTGFAGILVGVLGYAAINEDVEATPEACVQAIEDADAAMANASEGFFLMSDFLTAATNDDLYGMELANNDMEALTPVAEQGMIDYRASRIECLELVDN